MPTTKDRLRRFLDGSCAADPTVNQSNDLDQDPVDEGSTCMNKHYASHVTTTSDDRSTAVNSSLLSSSSSSVDSCSSGGSNHGENTLDVTPPSLFVMVNDDGDLTDDDPFADVRERMELLRSKDWYQTMGMKVLHNADENIHEDNEIDLSKIPVAIAWLVYFSYAVMLGIGRLQDLGAYITGKGRFIRVQTTRKGDFTSDNDCNTFAPLLKSWEDFYTRRVYLPLQDAFNRPLASNPGAKITVLERVSYNGRKSMHVLGSLEKSGENALVDQRKEDLVSQYRNGPHYTLAYDGSVARRCINLGSYNYLGFADDWEETCSDIVTRSLIEQPVSASSGCAEYGTTATHRQVEETVAKFLGKEDAIVLTMGFNTNGTVIPALVGKGDLIISDELNHTSIVFGARSSGAAIRVFRHNDMKHLEQLLRESVVMGKPRTRRPWNKILVIVEGIYSMEGEFCNLQQVVSISKKYGAYVYLDEAHSIGATGLTGRGCTEQCNVDTSQVDIMMGTFTKSFGGMGGYIAADSSIISMLRKKCVGCSSHNSLSPIVCQQVLTSFNIITGADGTDLGRRKLQALRDNANYFRMRLQDMGLQVLGQFDSPVIPVMLYHPAKISHFSRECFKRGLAVVVVGFPAVPMLLSRARICISASHTRADLDLALQQIDEVSDLIDIKYNKYYGKKTR